MLLKIGTLFTALIFTSVVFGQAVVSGSVTDSNTVEPIPYAKVKVEGQNKGALTDFDGLFKLQLDAGNYVLIFTEGEYLEKRIEVSVQDGVDQEINVLLTSKVQNIKTVKVVGVKKAAPTSVAANDKKRADAAVATDGMTKEQMQAAGDGSAGSAIARVPGVSVQGGKFVFVRGLGDRYTKTILNGVQIPGLDPDRNTVQLDVFPTAVIDNITVYKSFTPDMSADIAGGLVDVITKDFPSKQEMKVNFGTGYNSVATFNQNFIGYDGGKLDYLGADDGTRKLPFVPITAIPDPTKGEMKTEQITRSFTDVMGVSQKTALLNHNYGFSTGNQFKNILKKEKIDYGFNFALNYKNVNTLYEDATFGNYRKEQEFDQNELKLFQLRSGVIAQNDVLWTMLFGNSLKFDRYNRMNMILFHTQNGQSTASTSRTVIQEGNDGVLVQENLQYTQRRITNLNINGSHRFKNNEAMKMTWKLSPTVSKISDPDWRSSIFEEYVDDNGEVAYRFEPSVGSEMRRIFREMNEQSLDARMDFEYGFRVWSDSLKSTLKYGVSGLAKQRSFDVYDYVFNIRKMEATTANPDYYFQEENLWTVESDSGLYATGQLEKANIFDGRQYIMGAYVMNELPISKNFNATYGVRMEKAQNYYTGYDANTQEDINNLKVLDNLNILPSANFVYKIKEQATDSTDRRRTNFRASYAQTVARPSFREKSTVSILDPISGRRFNGNIDLKATNIHNLDFRWEYFYGRTELLSASVFYKKFINPIEIATFEVAPNEVQPVNAGVADVYGLELEARKAIGFKRESQEHLNLMVGANYNYIISRVDMDQVVLNNGGVEESEREVREQFAREGETIGKYRTMYGQSPYAVNAFLTFSNTAKGFSFNASYNVQGKRLAVIGIGQIPDVFELPFQSLNLRAAMAFGEEKKWSASVSGKNLLMATRQQVFQSFQAQDQVYYSYNPGMTLTASIAYKIK